MHGMIPALKLVTQEDIMTQVITGAAASSSKALPLPETRSRAVSRSLLARSPTTQARSLKVTCNKILVIPTSCKWGVKNCTYMIRHVFSFFVVIFLFLGLRNALLT